MKINLTKNQFLVFSIFSLLFSLSLGFLVICEIQTPLSNINEIYIPIKKPITILVFGDMMLDRSVRQKINENGAEYPFEPIKDLLFGNDIVVANAEGPFTSLNSITLGVKDAPLTFTFDQSLLSVLKNLGFTLLGQANNHTLNFGISGFNQSTTSITNSGLNYFGDPQNKNINLYSKEINGEKIAFIAFNEFSYQGLENITAAIKEAKNNFSYLIVYPHWGEEYNPSFTPSQQKMAHAFIDAGANVVIGTHPHVIEPIEIYNNKPIFYSIGNFIFDQSQTGPTSEGLAIRILLEKKSVRYELNPFFIKHAQASFMDTDSRQTKLKSLAEISVISDIFKENIATGTIKIIR